MTNYRELTKEDETKTIFMIGETPIRVLKVTPFYSMFMSNDSKHDVLFKLTNKQISKIKKFIKKSNMNHSVDISEIKNVHVNFMGDDYIAYINMITCGGHIIMSLEDSQRIFASFSDSIDDIITSIRVAKKVIENFSNAKFKNLVDETKISN